MTDGLENVAVRDLITDAVCYVLYVETPLTVDNARIIKTYFTVNMQASKLVQF